MTTVVTVPEQIVDTMSLFRRLENDMWGSRMRSRLVVDVSTVNAPLSRFEGCLDSAQLPEKRKSKGDICTRTHAEPDSKDTKPYY